MMQGGNNMTTPRLYEYLEKRIARLRTQEEVDLFIENLTPIELYNVIRVFNTPDSLQELNYKDIKKDVGKMVKRTVKTLIKGTRFSGVAKDGTVIFKTESSKFKENGLVYTQKIASVDLKEILKQEGGKNIDKVRKAFAGDLKLSCTCPAFKFWGFQYILTTLGAVEGEEENRFPEDRNKNLEGRVCKHLYLAVDALQFVTPQITSKFYELGILKKSTKK